MKRVVVVCALLSLLALQAQAQTLLVVPNEVVAELGECELVPSDCVMTMEEDGVASCGRYFFFSHTVLTGEISLGMEVRCVEADSSPQNFMLGFHLSSLRVVEDSTKSVPTVRGFAEEGEEEYVELRISKEDLAESPCLQEPTMPFDPFVENRLFRIPETGKKLEHLCGDYFIEATEGDCGLIGVFLEPTADDPGTLRCPVFSKSRLRVVVDNAKTTPTVQCVEEGGVMTQVIIRLSDEALKKAHCLQSVTGRCDCDST